MLNGTKDVVLELIVSHHLLNKHKNRS